MVLLDLFWIFLEISVIMKLQLFSKIDRTKKYIKSVLQ